MPIWRGLLGLWLVIRFCSSGALFCVSIARLPEGAE